MLQRATALLPALGAAGCATLTTPSGGDAARFQKVLVSPP